MLKGVPVSPGIAVARAYCVDEVLARREPHQLGEAALSEEIARFDSACLAAGTELDAIVDRVAKQLGESEAAIFRGHRLLVRDPALIGKVKSLILNQHIDAVGALHLVLDEYTTLFARIQDEYIRERMADIRDVIGRIQAQLALQATSNGHLFVNKEQVILVAHEVLPSQALTLERLHIVGIITETGGTTGHAAILSRSLGIPSVTGVRFALSTVATGDLLALDGREGHVHVKPDSEIQAAYRKLQREFVDLRDRLIENRDHESVTKDGQKVELLANVNGSADAEMATRTGATGVGLYRTEYLFLTHPTVPDEEEQLQAYRAVIDRAPNNRVTIRTLDIGGDKLLPYFGHQREANPFMGWRSIRLSTAYPEFFQTQLRAILRAATAGDVRILFPMVSTLEEVRQLKRMLEKTKKQLAREKVPFHDSPHLGVMLEVPAAVLSIRSLLREVDFVSIGSNDLIQYIMAADRDNPKVAHLCEPFSPPVLRLLEYIVRMCNGAGKPVTLCGEMAGRPRCVLPLLGMGLRQFSMSPAFVPTVKELVRSCTIETSREVASHVRRLRTFRQVREYLTRTTRQICPHASFLDTTN